MNPVLKRTITALSTAAVLICGILYLPPMAIKLVIALVAIFAFREYSDLLSRRAKFPVWRYTLLLALGTALIVTGLLSLLRIMQEYGSIFMLYVLAIVKISDMGGFAFGLTSQRLMKGGNHKLCPTISPNKSWEGLFGSVFASVLVSCAFTPLTHFTVGVAAILGLVAALVGTAGDLVESKFKRWVGVKDSSTMKLTNGMGGVLDMIDSLLFAPTVIYCLIKFVFKV